MDKNFEMDKKLNSIPYIPEFMLFKNNNSPERLFVRLMNNKNYCKKSFIYNISFSIEIENYAVDEEYSIEFKIKNILLTEKCKTPQIINNQIIFKTDYLNFPILNFIFNLSDIILKNSKGVVYSSINYEYIIENTVHNNHLRYMPTLEEYLNHDEKKESILIGNIGNCFIFGPHDKKLIYKDNTISMLSENDNTIDNFTEIFPMIYIPSSTEPEHLKLKDKIDTYFNKIVKIKDRIGYDLYTGQSLGGILTNDNNDILELHQGVKFNLSELLYTKTINGIFKKTEETTTYPTISYTNVYNVFTHTISLDTLHKRCNCEALCHGEQIWGNFVKNFRIKRKYIEKRPFTIKLKINDTEIDSIWGSISNFKHMSNMYPEYCENNDSEYLIVPMYSLIHGIPCIYNDYSKKANNNIIIEIKSILYDNSVCDNDGNDDILCYDIYTCFNMTTHRGAVKDFNIFSSFVYKIEQIQCIPPGKRNGRKVLLHFDHIIHKFGVMYIDKNNLKDVLKLYINGNDIYVYFGIKKILEEDSMTIYESFDDDAINFDRCDTIWVDTDIEFMIAINYNFVEFKKGEFNGLLLKKNV